MELATLLEYYQYISKTDVIAGKYYRCGENDFGSPLKIFNTNYRTLFGKRGSTYNGFAKGFICLETEEGKDRSDFLRSERTGQEVNKQHTVRMRNSWLFQEKKGVFYKKKRGIVFEQMLNDNELTLAEQKLLCFLLILPGYFYDIPNYLSRRTEELFTYCTDAGYSTQELFRLQTDFLILGIRKEAPKEELMQQDYFYIANFMEPYSSDINFLRQFHNASQQEKDELKKYVVSCTDKTRNLLAKKYKCGGNFTTGTLLETTWVLFLCKTLQENEITDYDMFISTLLHSYHIFYDIDESRIRNFLNTYHSVFEVIYRDLYDIKENTLPVHTQRNLTQKDIEKIGIIDPTDNEGCETLREVSNTLKRIARQESDYHCIMEDYSDCRYFTSKETRHNYLEVHHLIPRAVANRFPNSIEVLSNYVPLCPTCHRKIHLAVDREREDMIRYIYNKRKEGLSEKGITIDRIDELFKFYGITDK